MVFGGESLGSDQVMGVESWGMRLVPLHKETKREDCSAVSGGYNRRGHLQTVPSANSESTSALIVYLQPLEMWETNFWGLSYQSVVFCYSSPNQGNFFIMWSGIKLLIQNRLLAFNLCKVKQGIFFFFKATKKKVLIHRKFSLAFKVAK